VLWQNGKMIDLGAQIAGGKPDLWEANAINEHGQIVGMRMVLSDYMPVFLWQNGKMTDLSTSVRNGDGCGGEPVINERGLVAFNGHPSSPILCHAFAWQNGKMTDLGTLGGEWSSTTAINNNGQIIGWATTKSGKTDAVLWTLRSG
jgi:probable HAF family extracellular repeat protein